VAEQAQATSTRRPGPDRTEAVGRGSRGVRRWPRSRLIRRWPNPRGALSLDLLHTICASDVVPPAWRQLVCGADTLIPGRQAWPYDGAACKNRARDAASRGLGTNVTPHQRRDQRRGWIEDRQLARPSTTRAAAFARNRASRGVERRWLLRAQPSASSAVWPGNMTSTGSSGNRQPDPRRIARLDVIGYLRHGRRLLVRVGAKVNEPPEITREQPEMDACAGSPDSWTVPGTPARRGKGCILTWIRRDQTKPRRVLNCH